MANSPQGIGPVSRQERIRFHREIHAGQEVVVSCTFTWAEGKSFGIELEIRLPDGSSSLKSPMPAAFST